MSSYKRPSDITEEAKEGKPNPYLVGTWAWKLYEETQRYETQKK